MVSDDIVALYRGDDSESFPARLLEMDHTNAVARVRFLASQPHEHVTVPLEHIQSRTSHDDMRALNMNVRQRGGYACQPQAWIMLDPDGHEGRALTEYHRQAQRFADIDARLDASEDHVSPTAVNTVRPIRDRDWALSQDELVAVCRQLPHRVEAQAEIDTNMHNTMIPPNHCPLMWIPSRTSEATWIRRHDNGEIERWTTDQACEYLATVFLNARPESSKSRANDTAQSSTTPSSVSSAPVYLTLNQRSEQKAISAKAPRREEALAAIAAECEQLRRNHVFSAPIAYEDIPEDHKQNVLRTFMFVVDKYNADLQYTRSKARLVANGATQAAHTHGPVASPVMSGFSVKLMLAMAARRGLKVASMDIVEAFCQVPYPKGYRCFVRLHGLLEAEFGKYVELFKCLYGTKNAAREFYIRITEGLVRHGYEKCDIDQALLRRADPVTGKYLYLGLHVDDTLIVYSQDEQLQHLLSALQDIFGVDKVKLERQPSTFLGMSLDYHHDNAISVGQMGYIQSVCERFEKELGTRDEKYPHGPDGLKVPHLPSQSVPLTPVQRQAYMELVGCLGYAALTRASIQAQLTYLQSRIASPSIGDWSRALKVLRYLKCTMEYAIKYPGPCSPDATEDEIRDRNRLWATVDASYAACSDGRGITAITISLGTMCPPVLVKNRKQGSITKSSCESEYYGYGDGTQVIQFARNVAEFLHCDVSLPTPLENDNQAALNLASSPMIGKGLRHVELRAHYFKDAILRGIVQPVWRPTHQLLADFPTKPVMGPRFHELDDWYRNGVPWDKIPKLPPQPNSVFQMGVSQGAAHILQTMPRDD
jgi:hypothetical protein